MIKTLRTTTKYFATQEKEANDLIADVSESTNGDVIKKQIERKNHKDYGEYFEATIVEELTTSKSILENGF